MFSVCALSLLLRRIPRRCGHRASETRAPSSGISGFSCSALAAEGRILVLAALGSRCRESCSVCFGRQGAADVLMWIVLYESILLCVCPGPPWTFLIQIHHAHNQYLLEYECSFLKAETCAMEIVSTKI